MVELYLHSRMMRWAGYVILIQGFGGIAGRKETTRIFREIGWGGMDWIHLAEDRDQWRALANTVMNLRVP
jgi:hypothetical protein